MNFLILLFLVLYGVVATPISTTNNNQRIVGGSDAAPGQFPYQASLRNATMDHFCGGSIITKRVILTSCRCTTIFQPSEMRVVVGSIYLNGGATYLVAFSFPGEDCEVYELGLVGIQGEFSFNEFVQPIEVIESRIPVDIPVTVSGWGIKSIWSPNASNTLQHVNLKVISHEKCRIIYPTLDDSLMCTYKFNPTRQGLCLYDEGNPLVYKGKQVGIVSGVLYCALLLPDVHLRIHEDMMEWIKNIINII